MKALFVALFATFTVGAALASGGGNLKVDMTSSDSNLTMVEISTAKLSHFEIDLTNSYGKKLYSMKTTAPTNDFNKKYDFSKLEDGIYWYSVKMDKETTTKKLEMDNGTLEVLEIRKSIEPTFTYKDKILKVSYLNLQEEDAKLYVYDSSNKLLTKAEIGSDFAIHKAVDFTDKKKDTYNVIITNSMEVHEYTVSVE